MEGIQHRIDCPARLRSDPDDIELRARWLELGYVMTMTRCRHCGRGALVKSVAPAGEQP
jgi:hypothetical protein